MKAFFATCGTVLMGALLASPVPAQTMLFDFGNATTDPAPSTGVNLVSHNAQSLASVVDTSGAPTAVTLTLTSATGFNEIGPNLNGTTAPGAPADGFFSIPSLEEITKDNLFGHISNFNAGGPRPSATFDIAGLVPNTKYNFTFFASRLGVTNNRDALYTVSGVNNGSDFLDASANTSNIAQVLGIESTAAGVLTLTVGPGPGPDDSNGFFYLGGMHITQIPEPDSMLLFSLGGLALVTIRRTRR